MPFEIALACHNYNSRYCVFADTQCAKDFSCSDCSSLINFFWISSKEPRDRSISGSKDSYWWKRDKDDDNDEKCKWSKQILSEGYGSDISHAVLELDAIAGKYKIETTNEFLLKLEKERKPWRLYS